MHPYEVKRRPPSASQHVGAGPYSPVLEIVAERIAVISGQVAVSENGNVAGETIEDQTEVTLENCRQQLASAGYALSDVFKVNVFMADISEWDRFNEVYQGIMPDPLPVRTAVQCVLLEGFRIEIEMWAAR